MKNVYLFNPENDLALAHGGLHYTAPRMPLKMAIDLASLPRWYADEENKATWITATQLRQASFSPEQRLIPWGWNQSLLHEARCAGFPDDSLPTEHQIRLIRNLSHRRTSVEILQEIKQLDPELLCGESTECRSFSDIEHFQASHSHTLLKAPWSCSGRGLLALTQEKISHQSRGWINGLLASQGSIIAEALLEKTCDFAMEFYADGSGEVSFAGYSLFETDHRGTYLGNILDSDENLEKRISQWIPVSLLDIVLHYLEKKLSALLAPCHYQGFLGVDMLITPSQASHPFCLLPCVELNLRMNMGMVAHRLTQRFLENGKQGIFRIDFFSSPILLLLDHKENETQFPSQFSDSFIQKGYYSLTPITKTSQYRAAVWIKK